MELRHLRYFIAVAEELHFRQAAARLHVAQPAVSEQVRRLEEDLGVRLLDRTQRRVSLTPAGAAFLVEARRVLEQAERAERAAKRSQDSRGGRLRLGHLPDSIPLALPRALGTFAVQTPGVHVTLETHPSEELIRQVRDGELDAAVVCLPAPAAGLRVVALGEEGVTVALGESHPAVASRAVSPRQLARTPLLMMARTINPAFYDAVITSWRDAGIAAAPVEMAEPNVEHLLLAAAAGAGAALVPDSAARRFAGYATPGVRFVPLSSPHPTCEVVVVACPDHPGIALSSFLRHAEAAAAPARGEEHVQLRVIGVDARAAHDGRSAGGAAACNAGFLSLR